MENLTTFTEVVQWDNQAHGEIQKIAAHLNALNSFETSITSFEAACKVEHAKKPLLRWMFTSHEHEKWIREARQCVQQQREALPKIADALQAAIDKTPDSRDEQRVMLADLGTARKTLSQQKREVSAEMRQIRVTARQQSTAIGTGLDLILSTPRSRRLNRLAIRLSKEAALAPHESSSMALERQINTLERTMLWIEKFHD